MSLADKPVYPVHNDEGACSLIDYNNEKKLQSGITYKQWLVGMLASNPNLIITFRGNDDRYYPDIKISAEMIEVQADELIKRLEKH